MTTDGVRLAAAPPDPGPLLELSMAFWGSKAILSAVEVGVFTALAGGRYTAEELRDRLGLHVRGARDLFDVLVALGALDRDETGRYANSPVAAAYLDAAQPGYLGGWLNLVNGRIYGNWGSLTDALRTGQPQNELKHGGPDLFEAIYADPQRLRLFLRGMTGVSMGASIEIARRFPFQDYRTFVDIGCAEGGLSMQVGRAHPHLTGGGFDLPPVGPVFEEYMATHGLANRLRFHPGDFWTDPLPTADVLAMGHILHDWDLSQKLTLLKKAHDALPDGGVLIVHESLIDDGRRQNGFGLLMSLNMLIETPGGFDFTGVDCQGWMREVGFRSTRVEPLVGPDSMVIGIK